MSITYGRVREHHELQEILALQQKNLLGIVPTVTQQSEGFVTVSHTLALLDRMNQVCPHIIAKDKGKVVGYALCMHPDFSGEIALLQPMFRVINEVLPLKQSFIVMGQICIAESYRGKGLFRGLYNYMKKVLATDFKLIVTEVDARNIRSLQAHLAIGFKTIKKYQSDGKDWYLIVLS